MSGERPIGRTKRAARQEAVVSYTHELMRANPDSLVAFVPPEPGYWGLPELDVEVDGIRLGAMAFRPYDRAGAVLFVVQVVSGRAIHRVFAEGFAVDADGTVRPMSSEEWAFLNL